MSIFGKLITGTIKTVALPIKIAEGGISAALSGGDTKALKDNMPVLSDVTDKLQEIVEDADED